MIILKKIERGLRTHMFITFVYFVYKDIAKYSTCYKH